jgi:hypothetical protein
MRALLFVCLIASACGGRVVGQGNGGDAGAADADPNNPFQGGGLTTGSCHLDVGFTPNKMPLMPITHADVTSNAKTVSGGIELVCSGNGVNTYHYVLDMTSVPLQVGNHMTMSTMQEQYGAGAHDNPQFANGSCTVGITAIDHDMITGTIDCPFLWDDPLGGYTMKGTFDVPVP